LLHILSVLVQCARREGGRAVFHLSYLPASCMVCRTDRSCPSSQLRYTHLPA